MYEGVILYTALSSFQVNELVKSIPGSFLPKHFKEGLTDNNSNVLFTTLH